MAYYLDAEKVDLDNLRKRIEATDLIPSRLPLLDKIGIKKGLVAAKLEQQAFEIDKRYQALQERQAELRESMTIELSSRNIENLLLFRETIAAGLENPTFEDKRRWLEILRVSIIVKDRQAVITCRISSKPFTFSLKDKELSDYVLSKRL